MKKFIIFMLVMLGSTPIWAQSKTFILVRHAEKESSMMADPALTAEGIRSSEGLAQLLQHFNVSAVYSTPYIRTEKTVSPLATQMKLPVEFYQPTEGKDLLDKLLNSGQGDEDFTYLIAGHSNTIPNLVNHLLGEERLEPMPETDYGKVFIVIVRKNDTPILLTFQLPKYRVAP